MKEATMDELKTVDGSAVSIRDGILETRDSRGRLLFEYDPATGRAAVYVPGDLRIRTTGELRIEAKELSIETESLDARVADAKVTVGRLERVADRVFEVAKNVYRRVENLLHTRAGRIRSESKGAHLIQAESARVQAAGDVKLEGRTIHLG